MSLDNYCINAQKKISYRLCLANILETLDIQDFLSELAFAAGAGIVFNTGEIGGVLKQLSQWLH